MPLAPVGPVTPVAPWGPVNPVKPVAPGCPLIPAGPRRPGRPIGPVAPGTPKQKYLLQIAIHKKGINVSHMLVKAVQKQNHFIREQMSKRKIKENKKRLHNECIKTINYKLKTHIAHINNKVRDIAEVKKSRAFNETPPQSYRVSLAIRDHTVLPACHPTQVNSPRLNPTQTGRFSIYLPLKDKRLSWPR